MRSSARSSLFDARSMPGSASAASPVAIATESTSLISSDHHSNRLLIDPRMAEELLAEIVFLEKVNKSWVQFNYRSHDSRREVLRYSLRLALLASAAVGMIALTSWTAYKSFTTPSFHDFETARMIDNITAACADLWPLDWNYIICAQPIATLFAYNETDVTRAAFVDYCKNEFASLCQYFNEVGYLLGFCFSIIIAGILSVFTLLTSISLTLLRVNFSDLAPEYRDSILPILDKLEITEDHIPSLISELRTKGKLYLAIKEIEEIERLENIPISSESAPEDITYFAALKQSSLWLRSDKDKEARAANSNVGSTSAEHKYPDNYLAGGNDISDIIFDYTLGRKYSRI